MKTLVRLFFAAMVAFTAFNAAAQTKYISPYCEQYSRKQQQNECYTKAWRGIYSDELLMFYAAAYDLQWNPGKEVVSFVRSRQMHIPNLLNEACRHQPKCVFDLVVRESEAIAEKIARYETGQADYRKEVINNYKRNAKVSVHSDSEFMVDKFGLSDPDSPPEWYLQMQADMEQPPAE